MGEARRVCCMMCNNTSFKYKLEKRIDSFDKYYTKKEFSSNEILMVAKESVTSLIDEYNYCEDE